MGTNFYWYPKPPCKECGHVAEEVHIGKSSSGWCFSLHVDPNEGINNLGDWIERFRRPNSYIRDEYGKAMTPEEMLERITERKGKPHEERQYLDSFYRGEADFHNRNHSERGPSGLLRHRIDGTGHCVGHGDGTYDYITGEFS